MGQVNELGEKVRLLREEKGLSRPVFCGDESELSVRQLVRIEKGEFRPTIKTLEYIANRLDIPTYVLMPDYKELPKRYQELKYFLLHHPDYGDKEFQEQKEEYFDEIFESFYDDLPRDEKVLAGSLYTDVNEQGLTIPMSLLKNWNEQTGKNLTASDVIGKPVSATIVENAAEGSKLADFQTHIVRVINDEDDAEDSNSFMASNQMETILKEAEFKKAVSYFILELKDPSRTKTVTEELQKNKKYTVLSQQAVLDIVITFIRVIQGLLIVLSSQAIVVAAVMIGIIIYINIIQRSKEIGVMKAVGYQNRDVKGIFVYEALWIVDIALFIAFIIAQGLGSLANVIVHHFYPSISKVFELNPLSILGTFVFALFLGYGSAFFLARKISKMDPVESLRYE